MLLIKNSTRDYTEKINSINIEKRLNEELNYVKDQINDLNEILLDFNSMIAEKSKRISEINLNLEYLTKYHPLVKYKDFVTYLIYRKIVDGETDEANLNINSSNQIAIHRASSEFKLYELNHELQLQISQTRGRMEDKRTKEVNRLTTLLNNENIEKSKMMTESQSCEKEISQYTQAEHELKQMLVAHYHKLLSQGVDTRGIGLIWIIKEIYKLGCDVITSCMPSFLDDKSIAFLFLHAQMTMEMQKIEDKVNQLKKQLRHMNEDYFEIEKILKTLNVDAPQDHVKKLIEILPTSDRPQLKKNMSRTRSKTNLASDYQNSDCFSQGLDKSTKFVSVTSSFDSGLSTKDSKSLMKVIESPNINHKARNGMLTKELEIIPELQNSITAEKTIKVSCTALLASKSGSFEQFNHVKLEDRSAKLDKLKEWKRRQEKVNRYIDSQLTSQLTLSQKEYLLVEKAVRAGIDEKETQGVNYKSVEHYLIKKNKLKPDSVVLIKLVTREISKLKCIDDQIAKLKEDEMQRIFKEILNYDYLRRFNTTRKTLVCALIGDEALFSELLRQDRETKVSQIALI